MRMGLQSSILELCTSSISGHPPPLRRSNPQVWSFNGAQPEIRQEKQNHAHEFDVQENLEFWSHGGPRSPTRLLRTTARLNRYPRISDAG